MNRLLVIALLLSSIPLLSGTSADESGFTYSGGGVVADNCTEIIPAITTAENDSYEGVICGPITSEGRKFSAFMDSPNGTMIISREYIDYFNAPLLLHEMGHELRYDHDDGGIMSDPYDQNPHCELHNTTRTIAETVDQFSVVEDGQCEYAVLDRGDALPGHPAGDDDNYVGRR